MHAKEPDQLLFRELPVACGMQPFSAGETDAERATQFFTLLRGSIAELQKAYDDLLRDLQALLLTAFDLSERSILEVRAKAIVSFCVEPRLKAAVGYLARAFLFQV